jgi:hypothetical protein
MRLKKDKLALDGTWYMAGTLFHIVDHWGPNLHGFANIRNAELIVLRSKWLERATDAPASRNRIKARRGGPRHRRLRAPEPLQASEQVRAEHEGLSLSAPPCSTP